MLTPIETIGPTIAAIAALGGVYLAPNALRLRLRRTQQRLRKERKLVLTYDDGPGPSLTPRLLELLASHHCHATFFILGRNAATAPDLVSRIAAEGHELGCHTHEHLNAWKSAPWRAAADIGHGYSTLAPWIPPDAPFRPPYGKLTLPTWITLCRRKAPIVWWTLDSGDTHESIPDPSQVAERLAQDGGGIVLLHDFDRGQERMDFVFRTTELLLQVAEREGMRGCSLCEAGVTRK